MLAIAYDEAVNQMERLLLSRGCPENHAATVAREMARNSLEGTYTHGINRFARLLRNIDEGIVHPDAEATEVEHFGGLARMDGQMGLGIINAQAAMSRAIQLAGEHGIGLVALRNTNHWMRAATYGLQACDAGMAGICFTNTTPNMPTWGAVDARLGNNPLVLALPRAHGHVVLDMAMSQFSYGALELARLQGRSMPVDAGFDTRGELTRDPGEVIRTQRILPAGYWKGAGLSLLLDLFAGVLALGNTTCRVGRLEGDEHGLSQVFIAINYHNLSGADEGTASIEETLRDLMDSQPDGQGGQIRWPGSMLAQTRAQNLQNGIPVDERVWQEILAMG